MRVRNNDFATLRIKRIPYLFAGYQKVFRCKSCGKIYPEYVPDVCRRCGKELTEEMNPEEAPYDWHPCFFCDICNNFDGESPENMEREECHEYVIDDYHARQNRKKIRIVRGGEIS